MNTMSSKAFDLILLSPKYSRKVPITRDELLTLMQDDTHHILEGVIVLAESQNGTSYRVEPDGPSQNMPFYGDTTRVRPSRCVYAIDGERVDENMSVAVTNGDAAAFRFSRPSSADQEEDIGQTIMFTTERTPAIYVSGPLVKIAVVIDWTKVGI